MRALPWMIGEKIDNDCSEHLNLLFARRQQGHQSDFGFRFLGQQEQLAARLWDRYFRDPSQTGQSRLMQLYCKCCALVWCCTFISLVRRSMMLRGCTRIASYEWAQMLVSRTNSICRNDKMNFRHRSREYFARPYRVTPFRSQRLRTPVFLGMQRRLGLCQRLAADPRCRSEQPIA